MGKYFCHIGVDNLLTVKRVFLMRPFLVSCVGVLDRDDVGNDGDINKDSQMNRGNL